MSRSRRWRHASAALVVALFGCAAPLAAAQTSQPADDARAKPRQLVLAVTANGVVAAEPMMVKREDGKTWMRATDLIALGLKPGAGIGEVALEDVRGLTFVIDDAAQAIALTQAAGGRQRLSAAAPAGERPVAITPNGWGAVLNYDATAGVVAGRTSLGGEMDATIYSPRGYGFAGAIATTGSAVSAGRVVRLDTGYTLADPDRMLRATAGDFVNAGASFSRPVRMGGVKVGTDFGLRPDLVTFPVPSLSASAALPSAVDLIVNGNRQAAGEVRAGQFSVSDIPVVTGVNSVTVAVRDALGRETRQTVTTYASRALLRGGLTSWSAEAGWVRTGYATADDRYRSFMASGSVRHGATDQLTLEAHAEADRATAVAGVGASLTLGPLGLVDASVAASRASHAGDRYGSRVEVGFERIARPVSFSARYTLTDPAWTDVASGYGSVTRRHSLVLNIGFDLGRFGTVSAGVIDLGRGWTIATADGAPVDRLATRTAPTTTINGSYSAKLSRRINLVGNIGADLHRRRSLFASIGALVVFGSRSSAYAGATVRDRVVDGTIQYVRNALVPGDVGYRASVGSGSIDRFSAGAEYLSQYGHIDAQVEEAHGETAARTSAIGSLVLIDGDLHAAGTTTNSFALVETNGQAGVTVYRDNHPVGTTNRHGRLFVPNLEPYQTTRFSIDPTELGNDITIDAPEAKVRPMERVGVPVRFHLGIDHAAQVRLVDEAGRPLTPGSRALFAGAEVPVGMDGLVFLPQVGPRNVLAVRLGGGRLCTAAFEAPAATSLATVIGPVTCTVQQLADAGPRPLP